MVRTLPSILSSPRSELQTQGELEVSLQTCLCRGDPAEVTIPSNRFTVVEVIVGKAELQRIPDIETLGAELKLPPFGNREVLEHREIKRSRGRSGGTFPPPG